MEGNDAMAERLDFTSELQNLIKEKQLTVVVGSGVSIATNGETPTWRGLIESGLEECRRLAPEYNAKLEVRLWDGTRVDLLNDEYAIEADWPQKWAEAIGQSLYYAELTGKKPGIILLVKDFKAERRYIYRCQTVCAKFGSDLKKNDVGVFHSRRADALDECPAAVCGNGVVELGETCDDGNLVEDDGCTLACEEGDCTNSTYSSGS